MAPSSRIGIPEESLESLKRALIGVKSPREEAFVILNSIPEEFIPDIVDYFRILVGLNKIGIRQ